MLQLLIPEELVGMFLEPIMSATINIVVINDLGMLYHLTLPI